MRRLLTYLVVSTFSLTTVAAPGTYSKSAQASDFLKAMKLQNQGRKFSDFAKDFAQKYPGEMAEIFNQLSEKAPNMMIPSGKLKKIKNDRGGEDLQIIVNEKGASGVIQFVTENEKELIKLTTSVNKQNIVMKVPADSEPDQVYLSLLEQMRLAGLPAKEKPDVNLLDYSQLVRLTREEQKEYFKMVRGAMDAAERISAKSNPKNQTSFFLRTLLPEAFAAESNKCVRNGYVLEWEGNDCGPGKIPNSDPTSGVEPCNPAIYFADSSTEAKVATSSPAGSCGREYSSYVNPTVKSAAEYDKWLKEATKALSAAFGICKKYVHKKPKADLTADCNDIKSRLEALNGLTCKNAKEKFSEQLKELNCKGGAADVPANPNPEPQPAPQPPPQPGPGPGGPGGPPPTAPLTGPKFGSNIPWPTIGMMALAFGAGVGTGYFIWGNKKKKVIPYYVPVAGPTVYQPVPGPTVYVEVPYTNPLKGTK